MKKQKIASYLKLGILLFGISVLLWNCEKEIFDQPPITKSNANLQKLNYSLKTLNYAELIKDTEIQPSLKFLQGVFASKKPKGTFGKSDTQVADGLIISTEQINRIVAQDVIIWAFKIETPLLESSDFENFLVKKHNDTFRYYLVSYIKDTENDENLYKKARLYKLSKEALNLNELHLSGMEDDELFEDYEDGVGAGGSGCEGEIYQEITACNKGGYHILKYSCQHDGFPHGLGDIPPCDDVCTGTTITSILDFSDCESGTYDPPNGPTNDVSDDSQTGDGTGGDAGNSDTDGTTTITAPIEIEDPNCPAGSGKIMIDEVCVCPPNSGKVEDSNGKCVCPSGYIENFNMNCVIDPCITIKKGIDATTIKTHFNDLKTKLGNLNENGQLYFKVNGQYSSREIAVSIFNSNSVNVSAGPTVFGAGHTHTDNLYSMFSWSDVHVLYSLYNKANSNLKDIVMYYLISRETPSSDPNFYVLKVSDFNKFKNKLTLDVKNIIINTRDLNGSSTFNDVIKVLNSSIGNQYESASDFEKTFLEEFKNHGIKLYKSKNSVDSLSELIIENGTNAVTEEPCN